MKFSLGLGVIASMAIGWIVGEIYQPQKLDEVLGLALFLMLYPPMLEMDFAGLKQVFANPWPVFGALVLNFFVAPLLMFGLLVLFSGSGRLNLRLGLILYGLVPGGGMAPAFTGMLNGNVNLTVAVSAIGGFLIIGIVPFWAKCLMGTWMSVPVQLMFRHLFLIIIIPLSLALLTRRLIVQWKGVPIFLSFQKRLRNLSGLGLCLLIAIMFTLYGHRILQDPLIILRIAGPVTTFLLNLFFLSSLLGKWLGLRQEDTVALTLSSTAKNNAIALALAFSTFGPETAMVNAIAGSLVQMPILLSFVALKKGRQIRGWKKRG